MKLPIHIIERMVKENPDDKELGRKVRYYINWLRNVESNGNSKFSILSWYGLIKFVLFLFS